VSAVAQEAVQDWGGLGIHVEDAGEGEPVVFLHSSGMSGDQWRRTAASVVTGGARAIVPDLLGSGRSPPWPDGKPFGFRDDVELVGRLLEQIGRPAHLVGHSYGGVVALQVALQAALQAALQSAPAPRPLVRSIALYDPVVFGVLRPDDVEGLADIDRISFQWGETPIARETWLQSFVDYWGGGGAWSRLRDSVRAEFARVAWVVHEGARSLRDDATPLEGYAALKVPALVMTGEHSPVAARHAVERLGEALPGARLERFAGAGHMGPLTHVARFNELLAAHLREVAGSSRRGARHTGKGRRR
jgi:pimeloyl-ACP methyl ester carboxylesterase